MACMKLGSKADTFHVEGGHTWSCSTGLPSDVCIEIGETSFHLHKFPLISKSGLLEQLIQEFDASQNEEEEEEEGKCVLHLHDLPGGAKSFLLIAKFCYDVKFDITTLDVVCLRCASEHLQMNENYGEGNLISLTENFLEEVFKSWLDTIKALETCELVLPQAEELHIVSRCIDSIACQACIDPSLFNFPASGWNGIDQHSNLCSSAEDWWYKDVVTLKLHVFKRLVLCVDSKGMAPDKISGAVMSYAKAYLPLNGRQSSFRQRNPGSSIPIMSEADQKILVEELIELLPNQKGVTPTKFLLKLLRTSMILQASPSCRENLERKIGLQLDQAILEDLLIPNTGYSVETLYDIDCVQRIVDHFLSGYDQDDADSIGSGSVVEEGRSVGASRSLEPLTMVANLLDNYLAEVACDVNLKLEKFLSLAASVPDCARPSDDAIYRAIDIYLKSHPGLLDSEREQICRLMSCQKLSLEASTHAAQNERLPLRVIVQVLFFEQLRLRTSVTSWLFVSDEIEKTQNPNGNTGQRNNHRMMTFDDMKERVFELEKECGSMKHEMNTLKTKKSWNNFYKRFGLNLFKSKSFDSKSPKEQCKGETGQSTVQEEENHGPG